MDCQFSAHSIHDLEYLCYAATRCVARSHTFASFSACARVGSDFDKGAEPECQLPTGSDEELPS